jgi:hypothetical protein
MDSRSAKNSIDGYLDNFLNYLVVERVFQKTLSRVTTGPAKIHRLP